ncbi:MAG: endonuclease dU [Candidatus Thorarchaeota archaeon]
MVHKLGSSSENDSTIGWKKGVRVLGVAESFEKSDSKSVLAGVIMRGDNRIDGFGVCFPTIGGKDSTTELLSLYAELKRDDIRAWLLGGNVISWFNIVDILTLHEKTDTPVICVSYHPSEGIEKYLVEYFPDDWTERLELLKSTGERVEVQLSTGHSIFLATAGIGVPRAQRLVDQFTLDGRVPEPIRVARTIAAGLHRDLQK